MDYFKSLSSAVLAKASGPFPNFTLGDKVDSFEGKTIWSLHEGVRRADGARVSIFVFDTHRPQHAGHHLPLAQNAAKRLRTLRHPDVLRFLESAETSSAVYIATEHVVPVDRMLAQASGDAARSEWIGWGLSRIAHAVKFINADAASLHGNIRLESVFLADSGEWRLGGFEVLQPSQDLEGAYFRYASLLPDASHNIPPEMRTSGLSESTKNQAAHVVDSYSTALMALEAYNGPQPPMHGVPAQGKVPTDLFKVLKRMLTPNARSRLSTSQFLLDGEAVGGYFASNRLVQVATGIDNFLLATEGERATLLHTLDTTAETLPGPFVTWKVIPVLLRAVDSPPAAQGLGPSATMQATRLVPLCLRMSKNMSDEDWKRLLLPAVVKAYASPDRAMRMALLTHLPDYLDHLDQKTVVDKIWPPLSLGLGDSTPQLREATLRAILPLAPQFSERILNNDLLRALAKTQLDPEPGVRTNTTVLLGRLVPHFTTITKRQVLVPAFARSLKDSFVHARIAGLFALVAAGDEFEVEDLAKQALPAIIPCLLDSDKRMRDEASRATTSFLKRIQTAADQLPISEPEDPAPEPLEHSPNGEGLASSALSKAGTLTCWSLSTVRSTSSDAPSGPNTPASTTSKSPAPSRPSSEKAPPAPIVPGARLGQTSRPSARLNTLRAHAAPKPQRKLALGGTKVKPSLADTILNESTPSPILPPSKSSSTFDAPAAEEDGWEEEWDDGTDVTPEPINPSQTPGALFYDASDSVQEPIHPNPLPSSRASADVRSQKNPNVTLTPSNGTVAGVSSASPAVPSHTVPVSIPVVATNAPIPAPAAPQPSPQPIPQAPPSVPPISAPLDALAAAPVTAPTLPAAEEGSDDGWGEMDERDEGGGGFTPIASAAPPAPKGPNSQVGGWSKHTMPLSPATSASLLASKVASPPAPKPTSVLSALPSAASTASTASASRSSFSVTSPKLASPALVAPRSPRTCRTTEPVPTPPMSPTSPLPAPRSRQGSGASQLSPHRKRSGSKSNPLALSSVPGLPSTPLGPVPPSDQAAVPPILSVHASLPHLASPILRATSPALSNVSPITHMGNSPMPLAISPSLLASSPALRSQSPLARSITPQSFPLEGSGLRAVSLPGSVVGSATGSTAISTAPGTPASTSASLDPTKEDKRALLMRQRQERKARMAQLRAGSRIG